MVLHLLGKKSWNVYNADNVARVQRDEAAARAREEAEEQRMQEVDAARRLAILRGEAPPPLPPPPEEDKQGDSSAGGHHRTRDYGARSARKRKRVGEDDTDFELRIARENFEAGSAAANRLATVSVKASSSISLVDSKGHISLFSEADERPIHGTHGEKNEEAEREAAKKKRELQDQYQMRLVNAAGKDGLGLTNVWYATPDGDAASSLVPTKNVFGKDDPDRKVREAARLSASDPLAMMKWGAAKVRELEKNRKQEAEQRKRELELLRQEERREKKLKRTRRDETEREGERIRAADRSSPHHRRSGSPRREESSYRRRESHHRDEEDSYEKRRYREDDRRHRHSHGADDGDQERRHDRSDRYRDGDRHHRRESERREHREHRQRGLHDSDRHSSRHRHSRADER